MEEIKAKYSEKVMASDVFTLLAKHHEKSIAFANSSLGTKSTFYSYAKLRPLKELFKRQKLSKQQCFNALEIVERLKKTHSDEAIEGVLKNTAYDKDFEVNALALANSIDYYKREINRVLSANYEVLDYGGVYLPIKEKAPKIGIEDKLLALAVWSISSSQVGGLDMIKNGLPTGHYLKSEISRGSLLSKLISNLFRSLKVEVAYQATELLITTRTAYRNAAFELLKNGWLVSE